MARKATEEDRVKHWERRIDLANKKFKKWDDRYETNLLEDYYLGRQWRTLTDDERVGRYTINLVYSTIEVNKPSLSFHNPQVKVQPRAARGSTLGSRSNEKARLCEDTVQTFIDDPDVRFMEETSLALHEAHFRFGVVEVGYTSDHIDNPNAGKPLLKENSEDPVIDSKGDPVLEAERIIQNEMMFVAHIPAKQFRVSGSSLKNGLEQNDWVGYWDWHFAEDVKANKAYKGTTELKATGKLTDAQGLEDEDDREDEMEARAGMVRVWKIWDMRAKKKFVIAEGHKKFLVDGEPFTFLPFAVMKFHEVIDDFYPMPPVSQWLGPQDELNETRDAQRAHRRRFYRRYTMMKGAMDPKELEKLENGGDGVVAESNMPLPLTPVPDAPMGADVWNHLGETKQDMLAVSGVGMDQRGVADSETATQASIIDTRNKLRESSARTRVAQWLARVARLMLMTIREKMALEMWVKRNVDPAVVKQPDPMTGMPNLMPVMQVADLWQEITAEDVSDIDLDIGIDLATMSPVSEEAFRNSWNQVLALLTNPALMQLMAMSPVMLRRTLILYGIRQENDIQEIQRVIAMTMQMQAMAAQEAQMQEKKEAAAKAGVVPSLIEQAGQDGPGGELVPPEVEQAIKGGQSFH